MIFEIVIPVFALVMCGYGMAHTRLMPQAGVDGISNFVIYIAVPGLLFRAGANLFDGSAIDLDIWSAYFSGCAVVFFVTLFLSKRMFNIGLGERAVAGMGGSYGNTVMLGIPLALSLYGEHGVLLASTVIAINGMIYYSLVTTLIEVGKGQDANMAVIFKRTLFALLTNPVVVPMACGVAWGASGWPLPNVLEVFLNHLGAAVGPTALFALGGSMVQFRIAGDLQQVSFILVMKMIAHPLAVWCLGFYVFELAPVTLGVATLLAALPTGVNTFMLARQHNVLVARAGSAVLLSTGIGVVSLPLVLKFISG